MRLLILGVAVFILIILGNEDHDGVVGIFIVISTVVVFLFFVRELLRMLEIGQGSKEVNIFWGWVWSDSGGNENGGNGGWGGDDGGGGGNGGGGNGGGD